MASTLASLCSLAKCTPHSDCSRRGSNLLPAIARRQPKSANKSVRGLTAKGRSGFRCEAALHAGHVCIHHFENCGESPAFGNFVEGLYHCMEVARTHPAYVTSLVHEAIDDRDVNKTSPFSYATVTTYSDIEGGSAAFLGECEDYQVSLEFGVSKPYHQAIAREVAVLPEGMSSPLAAGEFAKTSDKNLVCLAFYDTLWEGPAALQLATDLSGIEGLTSVALYKAEGGDFSCSVRAEFADVLGEKMTSFKAIDEKFTQIAGNVPGMAHAGVYRVLFAVPKSGQPVGLVAASKATEEADTRGIPSDFEAQAGEQMLDNLIDENRA